VATVRRKPLSAADMTRCRVAYSVELARGSSYICSTQSAASHRAAVDETLEEFVTLQGTQDLPAFIELLACHLEERGKPKSASAVRQWAHFARRWQLEEGR